MEMRLASGLSWLRMKLEVRRQTENLVLSIVEDFFRPGAPATFGDEVRDQAIALALTKPGEHNIPVEQWTHELLAKHVVAMGIASNMSSSRVGDFLKSAPHKSETLVRLTVGLSGYRGIFKKMFWLLDISIVLKHFIRQFIRPSMGINYNPNVKHDLKSLISKLLHKT